MLNEITLISNICFEPHWNAYMSESFLQITNSIKTNYIYFDEYKKHLDEIRKANVIVVCLNFDEMYPNFSIDVLSNRMVCEDIQHDCIKKCKELYSFIKANSETLVIWFGFEDYYLCNSTFLGSIPVFDMLIDRINYLIMKEFDAVSFIDFKRVIATIGLGCAFDNKSKYRWNAPYSKQMIQLMTKEIYKQYLISEGKTKKCLILDCDNVLWRGILSEVGIEGIQISQSGLGRPYQDFQRFLINLYYHGVILTVCSKNDEDDVRKVFREHSGMLLSESYISFFSCNWSNKPDNIKSIAKSLNIGIDSMVFVDDSLFEIEFVKTTLQDIEAVLYKRETVYQAMCSFNLKSCIDIKTILERTNTYKADVYREKMKNCANSFDDYLSDLDMQIDIHETLPYELARLSELTQRTNKCTNGVRYTLDQLKQKYKMSGYKLYTVCLSDRFSNLGVVGIIGIENAEIDLFSLSCRALGRKIEDNMIRLSLEQNTQRFRFIDTGKNADLRELFKANRLKLKE